MVYKSYDLHILMAEKKAKRLLKAIGILVNDSTIRYDDFLAFRL